MLVRDAAGGGRSGSATGPCHGAPVTALTSSRDADYVVSLGADEGLDYKTTAPKDLPAFDVIVDTAGIALGSFRARLAPEDMKGLGTHVR